MSLHDGRAIQSYVIQERIAGGGMGHIYKAIKKGIGGFEKQVVLKQLLPELTRDPDLVQLFFREAQIHAVLDHANIVHIIDLVGDGNNYYIVMEYVRGTDLYNLLKTFKEINRRMPLEAALFIGREMLKGLDYAHGKKDEKGTDLGIVHRDVSPTNVLISAAGEVKITDFGIARAESYATNFFQIRGKAAYMSPEQAVGEDPDCRSDIYSAAVCIYEMIADRRPLPSPKKGTGAVAHYSRQIKPLATIRSNVSPSLDEVILSALSMDFRKRPGSAREFLAGLEDVVVHDNLHYTGMKLAYLLKRLLGNDPEKWNDHIMGFPGYSKPLGEIVRGKDNKYLGACEIGENRRGNIAGFESESSRGSKQGKHDFQKLKGKEVTSVKKSMLPKANKKRSSPRLPPPKRSVFEMMTDGLEASAKHSLRSGHGMIEKNNGAEYSLSQGPGARTQASRKLEETYNVVQCLNQGKTALESKASFPAWLLWMFFILGVGMIGVLVFLFVVWFSSWR